MKLIHYLSNNITSYNIAETNSAMNKLPNKVPGQGQTMKQ